MYSGVAPGLKYHLVIAVECRIEEGLGARRGEGVTGKLADLAGFCCPADSMERAPGEERDRLARSRMYPKTDIDARGSADSP